MMHQALSLTLTHFNEPNIPVDQFDVQRESTLPIAKGMASSTADIAATILATSRCLNRPIDDETIARLAATLEPTDSVMFPSLALFDHNRGQLISRHPAITDTELVILEGLQTLQTSDYHRKRCTSSLLAAADKLDQAWRHFQYASDTNSPDALGIATTLSAVASQHIQPKPQFQQLLRLVEQFDLYGFNTAHSGSVIGLLVNPHHHDIDHLLYTIHHSDLHQDYRSFYHVKITADGLK